MRGKYRRVLTITGHQSNLPGFSKSSFSYNQNIPDYRQSQAGITRVQSEVLPSNSIFTSDFQHTGQSFDRQQSRKNDHPLSHEEAQSGKSYYPQSVIVRKSSRKEAASPFHESSRSFQVWEPKDAQKSYNEAKVQRNDSPKVAEHKSVWRPSGSFPVSSQTGSYWGTLLPTSRGHYSSYGETNELAAVRPWSTSSRTGLASQTAPHAKSVSNILHTSVIKNNPNTEKPASSIRDFSHGLHPMSSRETPRLRKAQSYLFKDSQTSLGGDEIVNTVTANGQNVFSTTPYKQRASGAQISDRFSANLKQLQQSQREEPAREVPRLMGFNQANFNYVNPLYQKANVAQYEAQADRFIKYQHSATAGTETSIHSSAATDNIKESFVPTPHVDLNGSYASGSKKSVSSLVNTTTRGSEHAYKPARTTKSIYGFRGFKRPTWRAVKELSNLSSSDLNERTNSQRYSLHKRKLKIGNIYPSLSPKYSFGQREVSTTPAKPERITTDYSSPSLATLESVQTTTPRPFTSGFKDAQPLLPASDAGVNSSPDRRQFRINRRIFGLKGFDTRPLEGAKPSVNEPDKSVPVQQAFEGFNLTRSQVWQPKSSRIHRWYNKTEATISHDELSKDMSTEAVNRFTPDKYKKNTKIYTHLGFHPVQKRIGNFRSKARWTHNGQNPTTASASHTVSSAYPRSAGDLKVESGTKSEPRPPSKTKLAAMKARLFNSSISNSVRGTRVKGELTNSKKLHESTSVTNGAIVRLPKRPVGVKAVTYADILGSASFSGVGATTQTPVMPSDRRYFPSSTAKTKHTEGAGLWSSGSEDNISGGPKAHAEDEGEDFSSVEKNKLAVRFPEVDSDMNTSGLFLDNEGSGSGGFTVFSTDTTGQGPSEDLLELDYLRISTGNMSFKSMKLSHTET
nr:uncharacterized protein LOC124054378 isoform X2 [Scatophagus argus]